MKTRLLKLSLIVFSGVLLSVFMSRCASSNKNVPSGIISASGHPEYPPIMWKDGNKIVGAAPDLCKKIFSELKVPFESNYRGSWDKVVEDAKEGRIDLVVAIYKNDERLQYFEFTEPITQDPVMAYVRKGKSFLLRKWEDLSGKKGIAPTGESFGEDFDNFIKQRLNVSRLPINDAVKKLNDGDYDYMIAGKYPADIAARLTNCEDKIESLPFVLTFQSFYMAFSKKSKFVSLIPSINSKIRKSEVNNVMDQLIYKSQLYWKDSTM